MKHLWPNIPLCEVLTERQETPDPDTIEAGHIRIISKISFDTGKIEFRPDLNTRTKMILIRPGDLVVSGINAAKGAIAVYSSKEERPASATIHYAAYEVNHERADRWFLWWLLRSNTFRTILSNYLPGGIKTELKAKRLLPISVPLPPLPEQKRIMTKIEQVAAKIEEAHYLHVHSTERSSALMGKAIERLFADLIDEKWKKGCLGDYVIDDCYGTSEKTHDEPIGTPVLRMGNIQDGLLDTHDLKYLEISDKHRKKWILKRGDILVNRTNSAELVGKCAVFNVEGEYGFASYLIRLRLDDKRANPRLVARYINSPLGRRYMFRERKQMTGQANVNSRKLKALPISLPPLEEQDRINFYLDSLQDKVHHLRALQNKTAAELNALLPSILDKAFKGEL